jgi:hypothetical protein
MSFETWIDLFIEIWKHEIKKINHSTRKKRKGKMTFENLGHEK